MERVLERVKCELELAGGDVEGECVGTGCRLLLEQLGQHRNLEGEAAEAPADLCGVAGEHGRVLDWSVVGGQGR